MSIDDIKSLLTERWKGPAVKLCLNIVDFLDSKPPEQLKMLTFMTLARAAGKDTFDADVLSAITILSSSEISALDARAAFIDDDDEYHEIELSELAYARNSGLLLHPENGLLIKDFENKIVPYFVPSQKFLER